MCMPFILGNDVGRSMKSSSLPFSVSDEVSSVSVTGSTDNYRVFVMVFFKSI